MSKQEKTILNVWKSRKQIVEGIKNKTFTNETVEKIHKERMKICNDCVNIDLEGSSCVVPKTGPCCKLCGCSLTLATRSLSYKCKANNWPVYISDQESVELKIMLSYVEKLESLMAAKAIDKNQYDQLHDDMCSDNKIAAVKARLKIAELFDTVG